MRFALLLLLACTPQRPPAGPAPDGPAAARIAEIDTEIARRRAAWSDEGNPDDPAWIARRLAHLVEVDQLVRRAATAPADWPEAERVGLRAALGERMMAVDAAHTAELRALVERHGWPRTSVFGAKAAADAWLLAQHADRAPDLQRRVLALMEPLVAESEVSPKNYAYLHDRVAVNAGRLQRFGTQGSCAGDTWRPHPAEDPEEIDARRQAVGLSSMAEYVSRFDCNGLGAAAEEAYRRGDFHGCGRRWAAFAEARIGPAAADAWYDAACCAALSGDVDTAFARLERALAEGFRNLSHAAEDADLLSLREDPRWAAWAERLATPGP